MKDHELKLLGPPDSYDNTMLSNGCKCPRNYYWFMRRLDTRFQPPYFAWGKAWGAGINRWHELEGKEEDVNKRLAEAILAAEVEWQKDPPLENGANTWENLEGLLVHYAEVYGPDEPWHMTYGKGEIGFKLPIPGTLVNYAGAIDAPITWPSYGHMIREDKTTTSYVNTSGVDPEISQWEYASQPTGYIWALGQVVGEEIFGCYMNIVSKRKRKDPSDQFARVLVKRTPWELAQFMKDTVLLIDDIRCWYDRWDFPMYGKRDPINCVGGKGRTACIYRRLCQVEAEPWENPELFDAILNSGEFVWGEPWKPWEREGENE